MGWGGGRGAEASGGRRRGGGGCPTRAGRGCLSLTEHSHPGQSHDHLSDGDALAFAPTDATVHRVPEDGALRVGELPRDIKNTSPAFQQCLKPRGSMSLPRQSHARLAHIPPPLPPLPTHTHPSDLVPPGVRPHTFSRRMSMSALCWMASRTRGGMALRSFRQAALNSSVSLREGGRGSRSTCKCDAKARNVSS